MFLTRVILLSLAVLTFGLADNPYWVFFEDNLTETKVQLTTRAEVRLMTRGALVTRGNLAVSPEHLAELRLAGYKIRQTSRFLNAVSLAVENAGDLEELTRFPFIKSIKPVALRVLTAPDQELQSPQLSRSSGRPYGPSLTQNELLHIPEIHDLGYDGSGILIGVFDTGFNTDHPAFDLLDIQAQYDFVDDEIDPSGSGHEHGINVLSVLGGYYPDQVIGPAFGASYLLARTENVASESRAEEDNWVAALEWADSLGVDIISSSLNYRDFDGTVDDYPDSAIDGMTAIISKAANIAAERGILVVNSAGNEGSAPGSIWPPADSPHVLGVGAITATGAISYFSSRGPTYDGRIKPDVVAMGSSVYMASGANSFRHGNGTSFSAPLTSGLAALLLQAHPELAPDSIITLFQQNGNQATNPDNDLGYGIPDLRQFFQNPPDRESANILVYPNPSSSHVVNMVLPNPLAGQVETGNLINIRGQKIASLIVEPISQHTVQVTLPGNIVLADQLYVITLQAADRIYSGKLVYIK